MKHSDVKKILLERTQKFRDSLMETEAITGKDQPQTLEPEVRSIRERIISN